MITEQRFKALFKSAVWFILLHLIVISTALYAADVRPRIIGGSAVDSDIYPWQVALVGQNSTASLFTTQSCGGAIIHERWLVTAAHCFDQDLKSSTYPRYVVIGLLDFDKVDSEDYEVIKIKRIYTHPNYNHDLKLNNDIALVELERSINMTTCNPSGSCVIPVIDGNIESSVIPDGEVALISGWGSIKPKAVYSYPKQLQSAEINMLNCLDSSVSVYQKTDISANMICAQAPGRDTCIGDSGGPLAVDVSGVGFTLVGITSWGPGTCATDRAPGVYTRLANYGAWINDISNNELDVPECEICTQRTQLNNRGFTGSSSGGSVSVACIFILMVLAIVFPPLRKP